MPHDRGMRARLVVIVCFPGVQPLDVVGPHEVFVGASRLLETGGRPGPGYQVDLAAKHGLRQLGAFPRDVENVDRLVRFGIDQHHIDAALGGGKGVGQIEQKTRPILEKVSGMEITKLTHAWVLDPIGASAARLSSAEPGV